MLYLTKDQKEFVEYKRYLTKKYDPGKSKGPRVLNSICRYLFRNNMHDSLQEFKDFLFNASDKELASIEWVGKQSIEWIKKVREGETK